MNETQPMPPKPDGLPPQIEPHTDQSQMNARILAALSTLEAGQRALQEENRRIIELLEEPARAAEQKKQQDEAAATEHEKQTVAAIARGDFDAFSG
jgi:predicted type IV restriction endonuclease